MNTPTFVVTRRILPDRGQTECLERIFDLVNEVYNELLAETKRRAEVLFADQWYLRASSEYGKQAEAVKRLEQQIKSLETTYPEEGTWHPNVKKRLRALRKERKAADKLRREWGTEINACKNAYQFSEFDIHAYAGVIKNCKYGDKLGINIMQKLGTAAWRAVEKVFFGTGKKLHFRKKGQSASFEDKKSNSGIIYHPEGSFKKWPYEHVIVQGMRVRMKPVRKNDLWLQDAMQYPVKYCRIVRRPHRIGYHYFLQLVMEGESPVKHPMGESDGGLDPGISTMTYDTDQNTDMVMLSPRIDTYQKKIREAAVVYERRRRMANPQNYNKNGIIRKDTKTFHKKWNHTNGMRQAAMRLKTAYRKMSEYVKQSNGHDTNRIFMQVEHLWIEDMDYRALAKRSKTCRHQEKESLIRTKQGKTRLVHKYKRRKRYGASILKHAPADFLKMLERKILRQGGCVETIQTRKFKASQYDHVESRYIKHGLSERAKLVGGHRVQRDAYSAFLIHHAADEKHPDREACVLDFKNFLKRQGRMVSRIIQKGGDPTGNFGLKDFLHSKDS